MTVTVARLFRYPVKAARRHELIEAQVELTGIAGDREYMIVDPDGQMVSQRQAPQLALLDPTEVIAACSPGGEVVAVRVWAWSGLGADQGDKAAALVSERLGREVRVVRFPAQYRRPTRTGEGATMYADGYPLLVTSTRSLDELNGWLDDPVPIERFRPSIVLDGLDDAFAEDEIAHLQIGDLSIDMDILCARCAVTTIDQDTAAKGREPLQMLAARRVRAKHDGGNGIMFGVNAIPRSTGTIRVGDPVTVTFHQSAYDARIAVGTKE